MMLRAHSIKYLSICFFRGLSFPQITEHFSGLSLTALVTFDWSFASPDFCFASSDSLGTGTL